MSDMIRVYLLDSEGVPLALEPGDSPSVFFFENKYRWIKAVGEFVSAHVGQEGHRFDLDNGEALSAKIVDVKVYEGPHDQSEYFREIIL